MIFWVQHGVYVPHWNLNAHSIVCVTGGRGRVQIVEDNNGRRVFDKEMKEGQVVVIPQNFVVVMQAGEEGVRVDSIQDSGERNDQYLAGEILGLKGAAP